MTVVPSTVGVCLACACPAVLPCQVFWAFWLDMVFFYTFQVTFLQAAPAANRLCPDFGLAAWLIAGGAKGTSPSAAEQQQ